MTDNPSPPRSRWKRWALIAVFAALVLLLYPQLMDFGAELYRLFS